MPLHGKKLIVSIATLGSGGAERVLSLLSPALGDNYDEVEIVMWKHAPQFYKIDPRIKIIDIEQTIGSRNEFKKMRWFRCHVSQCEDLTILSFLYPYSIRVLISLIGKKVPVIAAERRDGSKILGGRVGMFLRDLLYRQADKIFLQTESNRENYHSWLSDKIEVIPNPIIFSPEKIGCALISPKTNTIVSVGRLTAIKNQKLLISAFKKFYKSHPTFSLVIYGEGDMRSELEEYISALGLDKVVMMPGATADVHKRISSAKAFVLSSDSEGMPNALLEAMALGLPCISTKVFGAVDFIGNNKNGVLVDIGDQKAITDALIRIADDMLFAHSLGENASKIYNMLNLNKISHEWIDKMGGGALVCNELHQPNAESTVFRLSNCRLAA